MKIHIPFTYVLKEKFGMLQRKCSYIFILLSGATPFQVSWAINLRAMGFFPPLRLAFRRSGGNISS